MSKKHLAVFAGYMDIYAACVYYPCFDLGRVPTHTIWRMSSSYDDTQKSYFAVEQTVNALRAFVRTYGEGCKFLLMLSQQWLINSLNDPRNLARDSTYTGSVPVWIEAVHGDLRLAEKKRATDAIAGLYREGGSTCLGLACVSIREDRAMAAVAPYRVTTPGGGEVFVDGNWPALGRGAVGCLGYSKPVASLGAGGVPEIVDGWGM